MFKNRAAFDPSPTSSRKMFETRGKKPTVNRSIGDRALLRSIDATNVVVIGIDCVREAKR